MFKGKITVIGAGFVGSTISYTLMLSGLVSKISLIDIDERKAEGEVMDINHGITFVSPVEIVSGDYSVSKDSDIIIITAGANQKPGETRIDLLKKNATIFEGILNNLTKYINEDTVIMVVTNPVDILTYITNKIVSHPKNLVIGSGTVLDTARLKSLISSKLTVDSRDIETYIIGEHGDTKVVAWSTTTIAGVPIEKYVEITKNENVKVFDNAIKEELANKTRTAAYDIIERKGATYYAIAVSVQRIVEAIIGNENSILTISSLFGGLYGIDDVCLSAPTIVNREGAYKVLEIPFTDNEINVFRKSADTLKNLAKEIGY